MRSPKTQTWYMSQVSQPRTQKTLMLLTTTAHHHQGRRRLIGEELIPQLRQRLDAKGQSHHAAEDLGLSERYDESPLRRDVPHCQQTAAVESMVRPSSNYAPNSSPQVKRRVRSRAGPGANVRAQDPRMVKHAHPQPLTAYELPHNYLQDASSKPCWLIQLFSLWGSVCMRTTVDPVASTTPPDPSRSIQEATSITRETMRNAETISYEQTGSTRRTTNIDLEVLRSTAQGSSAISKAADSAWDPVRMSRLRPRQSGITTHSAPPNILNPRAVNILGAT